MVIPWRGRPGVKVRSRAYTCALFSIGRSLSCLHDPIGTNLGIQLAAEYEASVLCFQTIKFDDTRAVA